MLRIIQYLIFGHIHKWVTIKTGELVDGGDVTGLWYDLKCEKCGDVKYKQYH